MPGKWVDEGENQVANILFKATAVENYYIGIYQNNTEPGETAVLTDLTEVSGGAYARIVLTRGSWTVTGSVSAYAQQTFTATGAAWGACYGYFITNVASGTAGKLMAVEHFSDGPYTINDGDTIKITPSITVS